MKINSGLIGTALLLALGASSCASPKVLKEYKEEIRGLREERTALKKRNRELQMQNDDLAIQINNMPRSFPQEASVPMDVPGFDIPGVSTQQLAGGDLVVSISNEVTFSSGKATLTENGKSTLRSVARELLSDHSGKEYWIEGHTDTDPIRKSNWANNRELSYARASAVHMFLVNQCSVPDDACRVVAAGQYDPVESGSSSSAKAKNRRVQIVVRHPRS